MSRGGVVVPFGIPSQRHGQSSIVCTAEEIILHMCGKLIIRPSIVFSVCIVVNMMGDVKIMICISETF